MESDSSEPSLLRAGLDKLLSLFSRTEEDTTDPVEQARRAWGHYYDNVEYQIQCHRKNPHHYIQSVAKYYRTTVEEMLQHKEEIA